MKAQNSIIFSIVFMMLVFSCIQKEFQWLEGDILFQDGDCGDFCEAIRKVTEGYQGIEFSHNGLMMKENGDWFVLEAIGKGVSKTPLQEFLNRHLDENGKPKVMVGRLKPEFQHLIPTAIMEAQKYLGKPYDSAFDFDNDAFYCSELIHFAFKAANGGSDLFQPKPMTYNDPDTGELFPIWEAYFLELGIPVPEGKPGLNPGGMSLEPVLEMMEISGN
ncbi:hypothetical protein M3O96_02585 [Aquiflexum sp. TKW24L]|uniref:YiiX/YebB-like N1pC/P60 family cysteine hydrolase n=1 Tax=Aquiflexum sp. TKW24L TaxID=2942212 RepID=UPI0020BF6DD4|nr:YiiX/YebB-like N1pC/P60 family cysteine hydrolase [Aquiflexum sp. TKW24L]MCL6257959.1 hypothetical protein [Aquiflexum sp. TKW24L]